MTLERNRMLWSNASLIFVIGFSSICQTGQAIRKSFVQFRLIADSLGQETQVMKLEANGELLHVQKKVVLNLEDIVGVEINRDNTSVLYWVVVTLSTEAAKRFATMTEQNINRRLAIIVGGKLIAAPMIKARITHGRIPLGGAMSQQKAAEPFEQLESVAPRLKKAK